jgi:anti-sigma B factor antagonist
MRLTLQQPLDITAAREGTRIVLTLSGELDLATAPEFEAHAVGALAQGADPLVVDLSALTFMDSSGLRVLLAGHEPAQQDGRRFVVVHGSSAVDRIFALTNVEDALTVVRSLDDV